MSELLNAVLMGAVAMASFVAMLFFLRFWRQTRDSLFLLFAIAFLDLRLRSRVLRLRIMLLRSDVS